MKNVIPLYKDWRTAKKTSNVATVIGVFLFIVMIGFKSCNSNLPNYRYYINENKK